jgi:hypothetical protein
MKRYFHTYWVGSSPVDKGNAIDRATFIDLDRIGLMEKLCIFTVPGNMADPSSPGMSQVILPLSRVKKI